MDEHSNIVQIRTPTPVARATVRELPVADCHDHEAERAVLASVLLTDDPTECDRRLTLISMYGVTPESMHHPAHAVILTAMLAVRAKRLGLDILTLTGELRAMERLNAVGGAKYVGELTDYLPTAAHLESHAGIVARHSRARKLGMVGHRLMHAAKQYSADPDALRDLAIRTLGEVRAPGKPAQSLGGESDALIARIQSAGEGVAPGVTSGLIDLDNATQGMHPGELIILGARPRVGKTSLLLQLSRYAAEHHGPVHFASLEMSRGGLHDRLAAAEAGIDATHLRNPKLLTPDDMQRLMAGLNIIDGLDGLRVDDTRPRQTVSEIMAGAYATRDACGGLSLVVVDYLQLVKPSVGTERQDERVQLKIIGQGLKDMATALGVPVIAAAKVGRATENTLGRFGRKPRIADLHGCGDLEFCADGIWLMHREDIQPTQAHKEPPVKGLAEIVLAKQRAGDSSGIVELMFNGSRQLWTGVAKEDDERKSDPRQDWYASVDKENDENHW